LGARKRFEAAHLSLSSASRTFERLFRPLETFQPLF
jgi:hypothetical protein